MKSGWYDGDFQVAQGWGCTDVTFEPADPNCPSGHTHRGIDIMMPVGTPLKAPVAGISLTQIGYDPRGFGPHYPILRLPDGTQFLFGHTSQVVGQPRALKIGEVFAHSGNEGESTGPHIHAQANAAPGDFTHTKDPVPYLALTAPPQPQEEPDKMLTIFWTHDKDGNDAAFLSDLMRFRHIDNPTELNDLTNGTIPGVTGKPAKVWNQPDAPVADIKAFGNPDDAATAALLGLPYP